MRFTLLLILSFNIPSLAYAFTCKINQYVSDAGSEEIISSWILRDFNITDKIYSEVGYNGLKVDNKYVTGTAYIYEKTNEIKDNSGHLKQVNIALLFKKILIL